MNFKKIFKTKFYICFAGLLLVVILCVNCWKNDALHMLNPACIYFEIKPSAWNSQWKMLYRCGHSYGLEHPRMSPSGDKIVFGCTIWGSGDICIVDSDGKNLKRLTNQDTHDGSPSFSPDGTKIVFESEKGDSTNIFIMNTDGTDLRQITFGNKNHETPSFSPDGKYIVYSGQVERKCDECSCGTLQLFVMKTDGSDIELIETGSVNIWSPTYSSAGDMIAYASPYCKPKVDYWSKAITILDIETGNTKQITNRGVIYHPSFSSDGEKVIFFADISRTEFNYAYHTYTVDIQTEEIKKVTDYEGEYPTYIDGGEKIMFLIPQNRHGGDICTMNLDGSDFKVITKTYKE